MDVEARLLLYTVVLGAAVGLVELLKRRAYAFRVLMTELAVLLVVSAAAVIHAPWTRPLAWPAFGAFVAVALLPSGLLASARRTAKRRRYGLASAAARAGSALIGNPAPLAREAALYAAMAAADRGDETRCRAVLERLSAGAGIPADLGGDALIRVLPAAAARRWNEVLAALDAARHRPPPLLAVEAHAAADTGDLRRALRAACELETFGPSAAAAVSSARRWLLAAAGRVAFLEEAAARGMPVMSGPPGTKEVALARAHEALGDPARALAGFQAALRIAPGPLRREAEAGIRRHREGAPILAKADELETASLLDLEAACREQRPGPEEVPLVRSAPFTIAATAVTAAVSVLVFVALGTDEISLLSAGALSFPLIQDDHEWWRLGSTMLLHGGYFHLLTNLITILFVGVPLEQRVGTARTAVVYVGAGFLASIASAFVNQTPLGVGASGAAMGLIGALGVLLLRRPGMFRDADRRQWLIAMGITILATAAIGVAESDFVDNAAHAGGLVAGALIGWLLLPPLVEGPTHGALRRLAAIALCGLMLDCGLAAAAQARAWTGERAVVAGGAQVVLPAWMRVQPARDGSIVAGRDPVSFRAQIGSLPAHPDRSLVTDPEWQHYVDAGPKRSLPSVMDKDGLWTESEDFTDATGSEVRYVKISKGRVFALFAIVLGPDGDADDLDLLALRIGSSLRAVE